MDQAKTAIKDLLHRSGKKDTTVQEEVAPAVQHEDIERRHHEEVTTAVDREVHQDHYHTTVQPIKDQEVLPEQHHARIAAGETREFEHGNTSDVQRKLDSEAAQYRDETTRSHGASTTAAAPTVSGEHVHHHVHETIQPVIEKKTIEPHVTHTTVPVHEVHHNAAQHHNTSTLPTVTMDEFQRSGGTLTGRGERTDAFEGEPKTVGTALGNRSVGPDTGNYTGLDAGSNTESVGKKLEATNLNSTGTAKKASLMDKINPKVDADGDGKTGIMD